MNTFGEILVANAMSYHDKTAFVFKNQRFTFSEVNQRVNSLINALSNMDVKKGDHVGILAYNCPQYYEAFALSKAGIVCVPLNFRSVGRELVYLINNSEVNTIIVAKEFAAAANMFPQAADISRSPEIISVSGQNKSPPIIMGKLSMIRK